MAVTMNAFEGTGHARAKASNFKIGTGSDARLLIGEIPDYHDRLTRLAELYTQQPLIIDSTIKEVGDPLDQDYLDGTRAANPTELGITRVEGDTTILTACEGTALFYAGITQAGTPTATDIGTHSTTTIKASGTIGHATDTSTSLSGLTAIPSTTGEPGRQITATFSAALTSGGFQSGKNLAVIEYIGTDKAGNTIRDQLSFYRHNLPSATVFKTTKFFSGAVAISSRGFNTTPQVAFTAENHAEQVVFIPQDTRLVRFYELEIDKPVPNTYPGMAMNSLEVSVAGNAVSSMVVGWQGMRLRSYQNFLGTGGNAQIPTVLPADVQFAEKNVYPGWSAALSVNGFSVPLVDASFSIAQNFTPSNVIAGVQHQAFPPYGAEKRDVMLSGNMLYSVSAEYNDIWRNRDFSSVVLSLGFNRAGMFDWQTDFVIENAQLETSPDPDISGRGEQNMPFSFKAKRRSGTETEYYISASYADYEAVEPYTP